MLLKACFIIYKGDDGKEDNSNEASDKALEDGNDTKNGCNNDKSTEDIWSNDFAVSK